MITVTRFGGGAFALNPDLIERIETTPDTIIVMVDATRYIVEEPVETLINKIREDRALTLARVEALSAQGEGEESHSAPAAARLQVARAENLEE